MEIHPTTDVNIIMCTSASEVHLCQYLVPMGTDIAMIIPIENDEHPLNKNIIIYNNIKVIQKHITNVNR